MSSLIGRVVSGKYRVVRLIGEGGMGCVYEAVHEGLNAKVALKSLHPDLAATGLGPRFLQEARAAARIQSPHVVRVSDVDQTEDGLPYMVLELLEGKTLQAVYEHLYHQGERLPYAEALDFAIQICEGVEAAHEAGIVHRDLKPDNVMITAGPKGAPLVKLLDFGIAKLEDKNDPQSVRTRPGVIMGTPEYMAPEQAFAADTADARADVFSLGVMVFEMLAGHRPVGGEEPTEIAVAYMTGQVPRLRDLAPTVPPDIDAVVHKAMAPKPPDRLQTVRELREVLEPFLLAARPPPASRITTPSDKALLEKGTRAIPLTHVPDEPSYAAAVAKSGRPPPMAPPPPDPGFADESTKESAMFPHGVVDNRVSVPVVSPPPRPPGAPPSLVPYSQLSSANMPPPSAYPMAPMSSQQFPYATRPPPPPRRPKSHGGLIAALVAAFLILAGGTLWAIYYFTDVFEDDPGPTKKHKPRSKPSTPKKPSPSLR
jgi:eukaryotic-like serine/threonine-protein kinase